jgi:hypothetical protein
MGIGDLVKEMLPSTAWPHPLFAFAFAEENDKRNSNFLCWRMFLHSILTNEKKKTSKADQFS